MGGVGFGTAEMMRSNRQGTRMAVEAPDIRTVHGAGPRSPRKGVPDFLEGLRAITGVFFGLAVVSWLL
jgi:hypothetical protein